MKTFSISSGLATVALSLGLVPTQGHESILGSLLAGVNNGGIGASPTPAVLRQRQDFGDIQRLGDVLQLDSVIGDESYDASAIPSATPKLDELAAISSTSRKTFFAPAKTVLDA